MRIFGKNIALADFLPPIVVRFHSFVLRHLGFTKEEPRVPASLYIHPRLGSFSQFGEDLILDILLEEKPTGSYFDIGANDPMRLNNTWRFYKRGWRGVNVEPSRRLWQQLNEHKPEDINLNIGVGRSNGRATFYEMTVDTYSTFNKANSKEFATDKKLLASTDMPIFTLSTIWKDHWSMRPVDFISVDVEGDNLAVLQGNDWKRFRPRFVLVEMERGERPAILAFLNDHDYDLLYANTVNGIFGDRSNAST